MDKKEHYLLAAPNFNEHVVEVSENLCSGCKFIIETINYYESLGRYERAANQIDFEIEQGHLTKLEADLLRFLLAYQTGLMVGWEIDDALKEDCLILEGEQLVDYANYVRYTWDQGIEFSMEQFEELELCNQKSEALSKNDGNDS